MNTFVQFGKAPKGSGTFFIITGLAMIMFGLLIVAMPELLAILVAALIISFGVSVLFLGLRLRGMRKSNAQVEIVDRFDL